MQILCLKQNVILILSKKNGWGWGARLLFLRKIKKYLSMVQQEYKSGNYSGKVMETIFELCNLGGVCDNWIGRWIFSICPRENLTTFTKHANNTWKLHIISNSMSLSTHKTASHAFISCDTFFNWLWCKPDIMVRTSNKRYYQISQKSDFRK